MSENFDDSEHILNKHLEQLNTTYLNPEEVQNHISISNIEGFSALHVNIRSIHKNFENLKLLLSKLNFTFRIISLTETWSKGECIENNSFYQLENYLMMHQETKDSKKGGGTCIYIHNSLNFKLRNDLSNSDCDSEILSIEIIHKKTKNIILIKHNIQATKRQNEIIQK